MNIAISVSFGIAGAVAGYFIPDIARKISIYKCGKTNTPLPEDGRYTSLLLRIALCVFSAAAWVLNGLLVENALAAALMSVLIDLSALIAILDLRLRIIPNELVLALFVFGTAFRIIHSGFGSLLVSALCMVGMAVIFTAGAGFVGFGKVGAGDIKLAGAMGFVLGYPDIITALIILAAALVLYTLSGLLLKKLTLKSMFPFAPFMMTGMAAALVFVAFETSFFAGMVL